MRYEESLSSFQREKKEWCGDYMLVSIYPRSRGQERYARSGKRAKAKKVSRPAQRNLNDKNSFKHFQLLANGNFKEGDYFIRLSYTQRNLPKTLKEAQKNVANYIERIKYELKKIGKEKELKWMCVTEFDQANKKGKPTRIHHHILINNVMSRDDLEAKWSKRVKGKKAVSIGTTDSKRVQNNEDTGLDQLVGYLFKFKKEYRFWTASRNLKRPQEKIIDFNHRRRKMEKLKNSNDEGYEYFAKKYPNHFVKNIRWETFKHKGFEWSRCTFKLEKRNKNERAG